MQKGADYPSNFLFFTIFVGFIVLVGIITSLIGIIFFFNLSGNWEIIAVLIYSILISLLIASLLYAIFLRQYDHKQKVNFLKKLIPFFTLAGVVLLAVIGAAIFGNYSV